MADFSPTVSASQGSGGSRSAAPSIDTTPLAVAQAVEGVANIFLQQQVLDAKATQQAATQFKEKQATDSLATFQTQQLKLLDAMDRGEIASSAGRLRLRSNVMSAIQATPELAGDITKIQKSLTTTVGLGAGPADAVQARDKQVNEARSKGWILDGSTIDQQDTMLNLYRNFKGQLQMLDHQAKILSVENAKLTQQSSKIGIDRAKISLTQERRKQWSINALASMSDAYYPKFRQDVQGIVNDVESGVMDAKTGVLALQSNFATIQQLTSSIGTGAGQEYMNNVINPMLQLKDDAIQVVNGKLSKELFQTSVENTQARIQNLALNANPDFAAYMSISNLSRHVPVNLMPAFTKTTQDMLIRMTDPNGSNANLLDSSKKGDTKLYYDTMKSTLPKTDTFNEQTKAEQKSNMDNILESVSQYASSTQGAEDFAPTLQFLASPEYGSYALKHGIPTEKAKAATVTLQKVYQDEVLPAIQREFSRAGVKFTLQLGEEVPEGSSTDVSLTEGLVPKTQIQQPVMDVVEPVFRNGGFQFVPVQGLTGSQLQSAKSKAQGLNKSVVPVVNQFIRVGAHLEGRTDYQQVFEEQFTNLFSPSPEAQ